MTSTTFPPLTQFSKASGCGCKIAPAVLDQILSTGEPAQSNLLVGYETRDDAAVLDMGNGIALISTTDFFTPVVDDPFAFGQIAAANSISDVYAMGGTPLLAISVLGWPVDKIPAEAAAAVLAGARSKCREAGITISGGHSIDSPEPFFGLAVTGTAPVSSIKRNSTAKAGDLLYLTKPLGTGIISAAVKRRLVDDAHRQSAQAQMAILNQFGSIAGKMDCVNAMTDITGFGLLGHLIELAEGSQLSAVLEYGKVPLIDGVLDYTAKMIVPDNTYRNWNACEKKTSGIGAESLFTLCDPQTNGGLLLAVNPEMRHEFENALRHAGHERHCEAIGYLKEREDVSVRII